jgi:hypothetical protein
MSSISSVNSANSGLIASSTNNQSLQTLLASIENQPNLIDVLSGDGSSDNSSSTSDILDLSSQGQDAADQLFQLLESAAQTSVQNSADTASSSIQKNLDTALSQAGIDTSQEIDLQLDSNGNVVVSNNNSQAQQIENTINNNPTLKKAVTQYLEFMQAIAPSLANDSNSASSGSGTDLSSEISQLLSSAGSGSSGLSSGTVTLAIEGDQFQTSYQDSSSNSPVVLASSQLGSTT